MSAHAGRVMLIAAGPGVLVCATMGAYEFGDERPFLVDLLGAYPLALLAFLPAIPFLAGTLVRAFPPRERRGARRRVCHGWLIASWFAPCWHAGALQLVFRAPLLDWNLVLRHSACLWLVTLCGWICASHRTVESRAALPARGSARRALLNRPVTAGTIYESPTRTLRASNDDHDDFV